MESWNVYTKTHQSGDVYSQLREFKNIYSAIIISFWWLKIGSFYANLRIKSQVTRTKVNIATLLFLINRYPQIALFAIERWESFRNLKSSSKVDFLRKKNAHAVLNTLVITKKESNLHDINFIFDDGNVLTLFSFFRAKWKQPWSF